MKVNIAVVEQTVLELKPWSVHRAIEETGPANSAVKAKLLSWLQPDVSMPLEPDGSGFYFFFAAFYLQVCCSRVDDDSEEGTHRPTERQVQRPRNTARKALEVTPWTCTPELSQISVQWQHLGLRQDA